MAKQIAKLLTWASMAACLIVIASFAMFAVNQTGSASVHQQEEVTGQPVSQTSSTPGGTPGAPGSQTANEGAVHKTIDEASKQLTSPFASITEGSSSEWVVRGVGVVGALLVYGFGIGFLARFIVMGSRRRQAQDASGAGI